jgi:large subunit ribosomal protein L6
MSRLAKKPIMITKGVTVLATPEGFRVTGPKGELLVLHLPKIDVEEKEGGLTVTAQGTDKQSRANLGTQWSLLRNAVQGVHEGFIKILEIEGIGYRGQMEGKTLVLHLGYAHPVRFDPLEGVKIEVEKNMIRITGYDKDAVGRTASEIRALKKPEPYKGKGIRYQGEVIRIKVGKKATTGV